MQNTLQKEDIDSIVSFLKTEILKTVGRRDYIRFFARTNITLGDFSFNLLFENLEIAKDFKVFFYDKILKLINNTWSNIEIGLVILFKDKNGEFTVLNLSDTSNLDNNILIADFNSNFSFDNFVEEDANKEASILMKSISCYNHEEITENGLMFLLIGEEACGKTHLMQSARNYYNQHGGLSFYTRGKDFLKSYVESINKKDINGFFNKINSYDILLIDDIDIFMGKKGTMNAFLNIAKNYIENGKYIVCSSRNSFKDLQASDSRLNELFENKIECKISAPSLQTRKKIIAREIMKQAIEIPMQMLDLICEGSNIRNACLNLNKIKMYQRIHKTEITKEVIELIIEDSNLNKKKNINPANIIDIICKFYNFKSDLLISKVKSKEICRIRNTCIYFLHRYLKLSYSQIGVILNKKHSTIILSYKNINNLIKNDILIENDIKRIEEIINNS